VAEPFQSGSAQVRVKKTKTFLRFGLATETSQALKYDVITYTPYEGINYTIFGQNYTTMKTYR